MGTMPKDRGAHPCSPPGDMLINLQQCNHNLKQNFTPMPSPMPLLEGQTHGRQYFEQTGSTAAHNALEGIPGRLHPQGNIHRLLHANPLSGQHHHILGSTGADQPPGKAARHGHWQADIFHPQWDTHPSRCCVAQKLLGGQSDERLKLL